MYNYELHNETVNNAPKTARTTAHVGSRFSSGFNAFDTKKNEDNICIPKRRYIFD